MYTNDSQKQWDIALEVLSQLFTNPVQVSPQGERIRLAVSGQLRLDRLGPAIGSLIKRTGRGKDVDPFKQSDSTAWVIISDVLSQANLKPVAFDVANTYLGICYELQELEKKRIHKGAPLFWVGQRLLERNEIERARGYLLLAFIEDVRIYPNPPEAPAYQILVGSLGFPPESISDLMKYAKSHSEEFPFYPEATLMGWELQDSTSGQPILRGA